MVPSINDFHLSRNKFYLHCLKRQPIRASVDVDDTAIPRFAQLGFRMPRKFCIILRVVPPSPLIFQPALAQIPSLPPRRLLFFHPSCILDFSKAKPPFPSLVPLPDPRPSAHTAPRQIYTATAPARMFLLAQGDPTVLQDPFQAYTPMNAEMIWCIHQITASKQSPPGQM